jgi:hypothetical protein
MWAESGRCVAQKVRPSTGKIIVPCNTHELLEKGAHRCYFREESFNSEQHIGPTNYINVSIFFFFRGVDITYAFVGAAFSSFLRTEGGHCYLYTHEGEKKMGLDHTSANK